MDLRFRPVHGAADVFLRFLSDELMPFVEKNYRTRPYKILVGHSYGGLFAIHALTTRPDVFNTYIAIDPSLHWNDQRLVSQADAFFDRTSALEADLHITAASGGGKSLEGIRMLEGVLEEKAPRGFRWNVRFMPEEDHMSISHRSTYLALDTIFAGWHLANPLELYDKGGLDAVHRHFEEGGKRFGYERKTSAFQISLVVHALMQSGRLEEAAAVLSHDPETYPAPWNQLDALARAYAKRGDTDRVIRYYALSLKANPHNEWAKKQLIGLGADVGAVPSDPPPK